MDGAESKGRGKEGFFDRLLAFVASHPDPLEIKAHIEELREAALSSDDLRYFGPSVQPVGHRVYDQLIFRLFQMVSSATPREELLESFLRELDGLGSACSAVCMFVLENSTAEEEDGIPKAPMALSGLAQRRLQPDLWANYRRDVLPRFSDSPLLEGVFRRRQNIELWHTAYLTDYRGEFDTPFYKGKAERHDEGGHGYWVSGVALPAASPRHPDRALFLLYRNVGTELTPSLPAGANQDWRVLYFLSLAYQMLNHQLASVAEQVHARRTELLTSLAPGILHHEIGMQVSVIRDLINLQNLLVRDLYPHCEQQREMALLVDTVVGLHGSTRRLYEVTDAFNNLERRQAAEEFALTKVIREVHAVCYNRLGAAGVRLVWDEAALADLRLESDQALLLHLLVNLVVNAVNAFQEEMHERQAGEQKSIRLLVDALPDGGSGSIVALTVLNNGPPIQESLLERIFEKGFTTRRSGHGHGLYICRLIAGYLGGELRALKPVELLTGYKVGFLLELPARMPLRTDLEDNRPKKRGERR